MFGKNSLRSRLQFIRFGGWIAIFVGTVFIALSVAGLLGAQIGGFEWWVILVGLLAAGIGYGIDRVVRFALNDPDWNNMFGSKED